MRLAGIADRIAAELSHSRSLSRQRRFRSWCSALTCYPDAIRLYGFPPIHEAGRPLYRGRMKSILRLVRVALLVQLCTCATDEQGEAQVDVSISALSAADVMTVRLTISAPDMQTMSTNLVRIGSVWKGTIGKIPVGTNRAFNAEALDLNALPVYAGGVTGITIATGSPTGVTLVLQELNPPPPFENAAPQITALVVSAVDAAPGDTIEALLQATDANGDSLTFDWTGSDGVLESSGSNINVYWTLGAEGDYTLTGRVTDPKGASDSISVTVAVRASNAKGAAVVTASVNTFPRLSSITSTSGRIHVGANVELTASAFDPDGNPLTFSWNSNCNGIWTTLSADATEISMRFELLDPLGASICSFRADATDPTGARGEGQLHVAVGAPVEPHILPVVDSTFQSMATADHQAQVVLRVSGHAYGGGSVAIEWITFGGTLGTPVGTTDTSEVTWTAPGCFTGTALVVAKLDDGNGESYTTVPFEITAVQPSCVPEGLVSHWTGEDLLDAVGGRDLSLITGTFATTAGYRGAAFAFDGVSGLKAPSAGLPHGGEARTIELWFRMTSQVANESFFVGYGKFGTFSAAYALGTLSGRQPFVSTWGPGFNGSSVSTGVWHHLAATSENNLSAIYVDGQLVNSGSMTMMTQDAGVTYLGFLDSGRRFHGLLDEVRVYDRVLAAAEIKRVYDGFAYEP